MPVLGYRKVDGRATRWLWRCIYCGMEEGEIRSRQIAWDRLHDHGATCWDRKHDTRFRDGGRR